MYLYKYVTVNDEFRNTERLLRNSEIRLNKPEEFNDPYDLKISPRADLHENDLREWMKIQLQKRTFSSDEQAKIQHYLQFGNLQDPVFKNGIVAGALNGGIRTHGIYCLSLVWNSILMWSHYANKHKGICIRFSIDQDSEIAMYIAEVKYSADFPQLYINEEEYFDLFFKVKYIEWQYEKEIRIIKPKAGGEFLTIGNNEIDAVIFGVNTSIKEMLDVMHWLKTRHVAPKLFKATMKLREFSIDKSPMEFPSDLTHKNVEKMLIEQFI